MHKCEYIMCCNNFVLSLDLFTPSEEKRESDIDNGNGNKMKHFTFMTQTQKIFWFCCVHFLQWYKSPFYTLLPCCFLSRRIKAALLPAHGPEPMSYSTGVQRNVNSPLFNEVFTVRIPESKLASKTLQVHVWSVTEDGEEECLVSWENVV